MNSRVIEISRDREAALLLAELNAATKTVATTRHTSTATAEGIRSLWYVYDRIEERVGRYVLRISLVGEVAQPVLIVRKSLQRVWLLYCLARWLPGNSTPSGWSAVGRRSSSPGS